MTTDPSARLAALNDRLRRTGAGGLVMITSGLATLGKAFVAEALATIAQHSVFDPAGDPYGEHDFGAVNVAGRRLFWKIDYYDPTFSHAADDPANEDQCRRVLTVMLAEEY